jgi:hypothetical protein
VSNRADTTIRGLQAWNQTFAQQNTRNTQLRTAIEELRRQRQLHLGAQLMASDIGPDTHADLQLDHDPPAAENAALRRRLDEYDRFIAVLQEDLAASRQAHADDIAHPSASTTSPVVIIRHQPC